MTFFFQTIRYYDSCYPLFSSPFFLFVILYFQVVDDDDQGKCLNTIEDTKFFILKAEWFWTRIAEGTKNLHIFNLNL